VFEVKGRVYGKAADGRTVLLFTPGAVITDDEARAAGLLSGEPAARKPARGLVIESPERESDEAPPAKPLARLTLAELRALCEAEGIDPGDANLRAEFIDVIEAARASAAAEE
jgi:hypothetical protein